MNRIQLLGLLIIILLIGGLISLSSGWLELAILLSVYLVFAFMNSPAKINLIVERSLSTERAAPGEPIRVNLKISSTGGTMGNLRLTDPLPDNTRLLSGSNSRWITLKNGQTFDWTYTISSKRGFVSFPFVQAVAMDPFGLISVQKTCQTRGQLLILPNAPHIKRISIRTRSTRVYSGTIPARMGGSGTDFYGVREYQAGDSMHVVNWMATARHGQALFSNEFEQERVADVGIVLDARIKANQQGGQVSIFDESILAAASLSDAFLSSGNRVGLLIYGQFINWTLPGYGKRQQERILHALARAIPGDNQAFSGVYIPKTLFPVNSQIVFISPLMDDDIQAMINLRAQGYALIVISPNAVQYEASSLPQIESVQQAARILLLRRKVMLQRLRHAAVQVVDWDVRFPFEQVVEASLSRPPSFLRAIGSERALR